MITTSFRRNFRQLATLPAGNFRQFSKGVGRAEAREAEVERRYKLPLPFMRVYVRQGGIARGREFSTSSRPNGTDKRINAKIQDTGCAPVYFSPTALGESR